jgi:hypothetical protein
MPAPFAQAEKAHVVLLVAKGRRGTKLEDQYIYLLSANFY